jgi:hypothetical protein
MTRISAAALAVGGLIIIGGSAGAMIPSSAEARGYVGPAPSATHEEAAGPAFGYVEHARGYVQPGPSRFSRNAFGSERGRRKH